MNVYLIAESNHIPFSEKVLNSIKNVNIISTLSVKDRSIDFINYFNERMKKIDMILVIIDDKFICNSYLNLELKLAQIYIQNHRNIILLPIVLNNAKIPDYIKEEIMFIPCDLRSEKNLANTQLLIKKILTQKKLLNKLKNNKTKGKTSYMITLTLAIELFAMLFVFLLFKYPSSDIRYLNSKRLIFSRSR